MDPKETLCPSFKCVNGAQLIGIVQANGTIAFLGGPLPIAPEFVQIAAQGRSPELRFRFAKTCAEGGCANWDAKGCGIAAVISLPCVPSMSELPNCGIRQQCRWYRERGAGACAACSTVVRGSEEGRKSMSVNQ